MKIFMHNFFYFIRSPKVTVVHTTGDTIARISLFTTAMWWEH